MRARLFLLLILLLVTTSFFWEDEEKQLRQLHHNGETAFQKGDFETAKKALEELLGRISVDSSKKYQVDWRTYVDVAMRLATACDELSEKVEADKVLSLLLAKNPPEDLAVQVRLMKARLSATRSSPAEAYLEMNVLASQLPLSCWPAKEVSFYHALEHSLNVYYDELVRKAKLYQSAHLYPEAIALYEDILTAAQKECYPKVKGIDSLVIKTVRYRLAESHFLAASYEKSLTYCSSGSDGDMIDREMLYLSALCHKEKKEYEKAVELFQHYTGLGERGELEHYDQALFEIGHYYYQNGQKTKAKHYFEKLEQFNRKPSQLAAILLARIHLEQQQPQEAENRLASLSHAISTTDPLIYECDYLRGLAAFQLRHYEAAAGFFQASLPQQGAKWSDLSLYHLGWCYVHLGDDPLKDDHAKERFFQKAEEIFTRLLTSSEQEEAYLSLAHIDLLKFRYFHKQAALDHLETALTSEAPRFTYSGQLEALLMRAEAASRYEEKEKLYAQATADKFRAAPLYAQGWYCRGLNYFEAGLKQGLQDSSLFEMATACFEKGFSYAEKGEKGLAAALLRYEAKANLCRGSILNSLAALEKLLAQYDESTPQREESLYLRGLVAAQLTGATYFSIAEESLSQVTEGYPQGTYTAEALYTLASLYYRNHQFSKAHPLLCRFAKDYPQHPHAAEAWFWAAEAAEACGVDARASRRHVYEDYPLCQHAAEAYFREYPYARYMEGDSEAINHLKGFAARYLGSPIEIVVYYLLEVHGESLEATHLACEQVLDAFSHYQTDCVHPDPSYVHFRYQALLQLAQRYLQEDKCEECEQLLLATLDDFAHSTHPLTAILKQTSPYPADWEEEEFKLAQCYLKWGKATQAEKMLHQMVAHYDRAGIDEGYYLTLAWQELGKLALQAGDYNTASNCFEIALSSTGSSVADETKLTLWLLQSDCYRHKKDYGTAMRLLSKVINAETVSPLRLKAMFLRSEIYELEGRPELAIRQLEATAKKGGDWGRQAKEKLGRVYHVE